MQMMADASFGPILISATFFLSSCQVFRSLQHIHAINILKNTKFYKNHVPMAQMMSCLGPFSLSLHIISLSVV